MYVRVRNLQKENSKREKDRKLWICFERNFVGKVESGMGIQCQNACKLSLKNFNWNRKAFNQHVEICGCL